MTAPFQAQPATDIANAQPPQIDLGQIPFWLRDHFASQWDRLVTGGMPKPQATALIMRHLGIYAKAQASAAHEDGAPDEGGAWQTIGDAAFHAAHSTVPFLTDLVRGTQSALAAGGDPLQTGMLAAGPYGQQVAQDQQTFSEQSHDRSPIASTAGDLAGLIAQAYLLGKVGGGALGKVTAALDTFGTRGKAAKAAAGAAKGVLNARPVKMGALGAAQGALQGASTNGSLGERVQQAKQDALIGGALGGLVGSGGAVGHFIGGRVVRSVAAALGPKAAQDVAEAFQAGMTKAGTQAAPDAAEAASRAYLTRKGYAPKLIDELMAQAKAAPAAETAAPAAPPIHPASSPAMQPELSGNPLAPSPADAAKLAAKRATSARAEDAARSAYALAKAAGQSDAEAKAAAARAAGMARGGSTTF